MAGISWLANDLFLTIYNPSNFEMEHVPDSTYILVTRQPKTANYTFQKMSDPVGTFGMNRCPPHHFLQRLRDFPPNLTDAILISSTGSGDLGLVTCSKVPLSSEPDSANTANSYTVTSISDDARRAQLPVYDEMNDMSGSADTSPIGMVLDLSSKDNVKRPMPAEEIDASSTPLPAVMVLNNEGVLSAWWFVYSESVRQGTAFPGLIAAAGSQAVTQPPQQQAAPFGSMSQTPSAFGAASGGFSKPAGTAFGAPAFGAPATLGGVNSSNTMGVSSFGALSAPGTNASAWGSPANNTATSQFGKPAFGTNSTLGSTAKPNFGASTALNGASNPSFGASTPLGGTAQPTFGSSTGLGASNGAFGAAGGLGKTQSPWGAPSNTTSSEKPSLFGGAGTTSGFAALAQSNNQPSSPFAKLSSAGSSFGTLSLQQTKSVLGAPSTSNNTTTQPSSLAGTFGAPAPVKQWGFPAQDNKDLGTTVAKSADNAADADMMSGDMDEDRPTAGTQGTKPQGPSGIGSTGFQLASSFKGDGTGKDDLPKPTGTSLFGASFGKALTETRDAAPVAIKEEPKSPEPFNVASASSKPASNLTAPSTSLLPRPISKTQKPEESAQKPVAKTSEPPLPPAPSLFKPQSQPEPAPLPPSPKPLKIPDVPSLPDQSHDALSPAGSPPIDLGEAESPLSSGQSFQSSEVGDEDDAPLPPDFVPKASNTSTSQDAQATTPAKSLTRPDLKASPPNSHPLQMSTLPSFSTTPLQPPTTQLAQNSDSAIKPPVFFQPPLTLQESPRSPSPVRNKPGPTGLRSLLSPPGPHPAGSTTPAGLPPVKMVHHPSTQQPALQLNNPIIPTTQKEPEKEPEVEELFEDTDDDIQEELSRPAEATTVLSPFIAHQDYVGKVGGDGVPAQAERLFRDINSMIDTYGLNARSLTSFVKGHSELLPDDGRDRADLEDDTDWCLVEVEDLAIVQKNLLEELENGRPQDVKRKVEELRLMVGQIIKQRKRQTELRKVVEFENDTTKNINGIRPELSGEQGAVLADLRKEFSDFQKLLVEGEESVSLLKAKLASVQAGNNGGSGKVPTVEAVVNTISKMTRMIEEKSGDIDLLDAQMRKLKFKSRSFREGTPSTLNEALGRLSLGSNGGERTLRTPPSSKSQRAGTYELTYTPEESSDEDQDEFSSFRNSLRSSQGIGGGKQLQLPKVTNQEIEQYAKKKAERKQFTQLLKEKVAQRGVRVTK